MAATALCGGKLRTCRAHIGVTKPDLELGFLPFSPCLMDILTGLPVREVQIINSEQPGQCQPGTDQPAAPRTALTQHL